jgi:hypothetical protein
LGLNNGTTWDKIDNSEPPLSTTLVIGNTTGANDIVFSAGQGAAFVEGLGGRLISASTTAARTWTLPDATGTIALTSQLTGNGIFDAANNGGLVPATYIVNLTNRLTFQAGTTIMTYTSGSDTITSGVGTNPIGFGEFGDLNLISFGTQWDGFTSLQKSTNGEPSWQASVYDNSTFIENACAFAGTADFGSGQQPYFAGYYRSAAGSFIGFQADPLGERLYSQQLAFTPTPIAGTVGILYVIAGGIIKAATLADLKTNIGAFTLAETLSAGNTTGANDISINSGQVVTYNNSSFTSDIGTANLTDNRTINFPDNSGTVALTSDIPSVAITLNRLPIGTGTAITDSNWEIVPNASAGFDIRPIAANSNIGGTAAANRIDTIFMASTIDYANDLAFSSTSTRMTLSTAGNLGLGVAPNANERLTVRGQPSTTTTLNVTGSGNTNATTNTNLQSNSGTSRFIINDDGQQAWGIGTTAIPNAQFGHIASVTGYNFGFGFYGTSNANTVMTVQMLGTTPNGIQVATQGGKTGTVIAITGNVLSTGNTIARGVYGLARNASSIAQGVLGNFGGADGVAPSNYGVGVEGTAAPSVDAEAYGIIGRSQTNSVAVQYTEDFIGVYGVASAVNALGTTTSDVIGGKFEARGLNTTGDLIALLVPNTGNSGTVVFGLDNPIANTFFSVRSQGNDDTTFLTTMQNSSGVRKFAVRDDGLSQFNTALTQNSGLGGAYQVRNIIADWTSASSTNEIEAGLSQRLTNTPTSDSTVRSAAARFSAQKTGAFEVFQTTGVIAEVLNTGSASYDVNSAAGMYGLQALLGNTSTPTLINNAFAIRTDTTSQAAGTFAHFGGINIELTNSTNTIIGNMYGIRVSRPCEHNRFICYK